MGRLYPTPSQLLRGKIGFLVVNGLGIFLPVLNTKSASCKNIKSCRGVGVQAGEIMTGNCKLSYYKIFGVLELHLPAEW